MTAALDTATLYGLTAAQGWSAPSAVDLYGIDGSKGLPATQKCKYGDEPATKRVVWADGRAYVPVCDKHLATAKSKLSDVVAVHDIPSPAHALQVDDHGSCEEAGQLYGGAFCLATHKPGVCAGTKRGGYRSGQPQPQAHQRPSVAVPTAPVAKSQQQAMAEQAATAGYQQAYLAAQRLAGQLGGNQGHGRVMAAAHDYARAQHQHGRAVARADALRTKAQGKHDTAVARNLAIAKANAAAQAAAIARANAAAQKQKLHAAARRHPRAKAHHSIWTDEVALYGLAHADPLGLYAQAALAHWACGIGEFCRNPLHPGPCKGWKHTLHAVAPGAYHAYEKARVEKANNRRRAKIAALKSQGQPVPKSLLKEITYTPPTAGQAQPGFTPPTVQGAKDVVSNIAGKVKTNVPVRAAQLTDQKLAGQAQSLHDVVVAIQGGTAADPAAVKKALAAAKAKQGPGDKLTDHPEIQRSIANLVKNVGDKKGLTDKERGALHTEITNHVEAGTPGVPQGVQDAIKRPPKLSPEAQVAHDALTNPRATETEQLKAYEKLTPASLRELESGHQTAIKRQLAEMADPAARVPFPFEKRAEAAHQKLFGTPAHPPKPATAGTPSTAVGAPGSSPISIIQARVALKGLATMPDPKRLAAYDNLTKADLPSLTDNERHLLENDLAGLRGLAGSPGQGFVSQKAATIHSRLFGAGTGTPAPSAAPSVKPAAGPAPAHVQHVLAVVSRSAPGAGLSKTHMDAYDKLTKAEFDGLMPSTQAKIRDDLDAARAKFLDPKKKAAAGALLARFGDKGASSPAPAPATATPGTFHALEQLKKQTDPVNIATHYDTASFAAATPAQKAALEAHRIQVENDPKLPLWLRARMYAASPDFRKNLGGSVVAMDAVNAASDVPSPSGKWYPTQSNLHQLIDTSSSGIKHLPPHVQAAINFRRDEAVRSLLDANREATLHTLFDQTGTIRTNDIDRYDRFGQSGKAAVDSALRAQRDADYGRGDLASASRWQGAIDKIDGKRYSYSIQTAINVSHDPYKNDQQRVAAYGALSRADFQSLPSVHQAYIEKHLGDAAGSSVGITRQNARHTLAEFDGLMPHYSDPNAQDAALVATVDKAEYGDSHRANTYAMLDRQAYGSLSTKDKVAIQQDMDALANGAGSTLSTREQFDLQLQSEHLIGMSRPIVVQDAVAAAAPGGGYSEPHRLAAYHRITPVDYATLPASFKKAIDEDLTRISANNPHMYAALMTKFHPGWTPPHAPAVPVTKHASSKIQEVLDTLYGVHPKAHTTAQQLKAYSGLRAAEFQNLQPHEQSTLLGDLSYIATTSKGGSNAARAQKLIDHFTPPGTPSGQIPNQPVNIPANAVAGQNRYPDPGGRAGMLKQATSKGQSGDGFTRKVNGGTGPWGKYGAAGVMLRHVDSSGTERYLMIERGPGISDPGKWQFPGGAIDSLETPHQGATRETTEELGFKAGALDDARVHGEHVFTIQGVVGPKNGEWKYTTIAATVPTQLQADLSTHHARAETSDAKWMTLDEIRKLDKSGKLLGPLAGGALERNVLTLYPAGAGPTVGRPGPVTRKLRRLTGMPSTPKPVAAHKPSTGKNLLSDKTAIDKLRQDVKQARAQYDGKTADGRLAAIGAMQGFDDTPTVVSKGEMDRLLATGDYIEVWRGVNGTSGKSAEKINEEMRSGPAYYGKGVFGNGYYLAGQKRVAENYSDHTTNSVLRILIPKAAVIEPHEKMAREAGAIASPRSQAKGNKFEDGTLYDQGRYAAAKGVDGIRIDPVSYGSARGMSSHHISKKGQEAYNWLNRSVLIIQEAQ